MASIRMAGIAAPVKSGAENIPVAAPVIGANPLAVSTAGLMRPGEGGLVTPDGFGAYDASAIRYGGSWFSAYYGRVFFVPRVLTLADPLNGIASKFYMWSASLTPVTITGIAVDDPVGLSISPTVGEVLAPLKLIEQFATPTAQSSQSRQSRFQHLFTFDGAGPGKFDVIIDRTTLIRVVPERPVTETLMWKTDVQTARDGSEQRAAVRQLARREIKLNYIFDTPEEQFDIFTKIATQAKGDFTIPQWWERGRLLAPISEGDTQIQLDARTFDVGAGDQLYIEERGAVAILTVLMVQDDQVTVSLMSSAEGSFSTDAAVHKTLAVALPDKPSMKRGAFNNLNTELSVRATQDRELFMGNSTAQELGQEEVIGDRVMSATVYTMAGLPVLNARPIVDGEIEEGFDWNFDVLDFNTGKITRTSARIRAAISLGRKFHIKSRDQQFYWNRVLTHCHGQRRGVWLPTWGEELSPDVHQINEDRVFVGNERYFDLYPETDAQRGLWVKHRQGWFARRIVSSQLDGLGNTVLTLDRNVPDDLPAGGPYEIGFLLLARQGSDDVQIERWPSYSFLNTAFTSTRSASLDLS